MARDNKTLGNFRLDGIPPAPRGVPQVEVTFDIDANGILNVVAKDKATGKEQSVKITASTNLSNDEVEKMARDADAHAAEDRQRRDEIDARNRADAMIYNTEKTLREHREKVSDDDVKAIEAALEDAKKAVQAGDVTAINTAVDKLTTASHKLAEAMYKSASQAGPPPGSPPPPPGSDGGPKGDGKDNVVDAEFVDVNDPNKK